MFNNWGGRLYCSESQTPVHCVNGIAEQGATDSAWLDSVVRCGRLQPATRDARRSLNGCPLRDAGDPAVGHT
jgi:hypothetical protein